MSVTSSVPVDKTTSLSTGIHVHESAEPSSSTETKHGNVPVAQVEDDPWLHDPMNARNWSRAKKWLTVAIARSDGFLQSMFLNSNV
jgi:hypothetical protein